MRLQALQNIYNFSSAEKVDNGPLAENLTRIEEYKSKGWV